VSLVLDPDETLGPGETTTARATVTLGGAPQAGKTVTFSTADASVAIVSPTSAVTNANGQAEATVTAVSNGNTSVSATANGASDSDTVRVPDLSLIGLILLALCFVLFGMLRKRRSSAPM
jgi:uncharacterized protein YjdB